MASVSAGGAASGAVIVMVAMRWLRSISTVTKS
jgi:hypothetical protein